MHNFDMSFATNLSSKTFISYSGPNRPNRGGVQYTHRVTYNIGGTPILIILNMSIS